MLMFETTDFFRKDLSKALAFHAKQSYKAAKHELTDLRELYTRHLSVEHASLQWFMAVELQVTHARSRSLMELFLKNMPQFGYDQSDKSKRDGRKGLQLTRST